MERACSWVDGQREIGRDIEFSSLHVGGYPYRFVLYVDDPEINAPDIPARWQAETLQIIAMAWNLNHVILRSPGTNDIWPPNSPHFRFEIDESSSASLVFEDGFPRRFGAEFPTLLTTINEDKSYELDGVSFGLRPMPDRTANLQLALSAEEMRFSAPITGVEWLGDQIDTLTLWMEIDNFFPFVEREITETDWKLDENQIQIVRGDFEMGPLDISTLASVTLDRENNPDGSFSFYLDRPDELIAAMDADGRVPAGVTDIARFVADSSARGDPLTLEIENREIRVFDRVITRY